MQAHTKIYFEYFGRLCHNLAHSRTITKETLLEIVEVRKANIK